jgi:hypothetical protein
MWTKQGNIFNEHHAQLPVVDIYSDTYKIYYSTRNESGCSIPMCVYVFKNDLKKYLPPIKINLELGKVGMFDHYGIMPTDIITLDDGTKYLYYIGWSLRKDIPYHNTLGLAISKDGGVNWEKYSEGPIFNSSTQEPGFIGTAKVFKDKDKWSMYYLSCREWIKGENKLEPKYDIKLAISINGIDWIPTNQTIIPLEENEGGIASFQMINNKAWFSVRGAVSYRNNVKESYKIKTSTLVEEKWIRDKHIELDISPNGWDSEMVAYPYIIKEKNKLIMFYNGNEFGKSGIGVATRSTKQ